MYTEGPFVSTVVEDIEIDFLILADHAEAINGKLYLMGGGWDRRVMPPGQPLTFAFAAGLLVPWTLTNREHKFTIGIETADGTSLGGNGVVTGGFNVGRPVKSVEGQRFRALIAGQIQGPAPDIGTYALTLSVGPGISKRTTFHVVSEL